MLLSFSHNFSKCLMLCSSHYTAQVFSTQFSTACVRAWIHLTVITQVARGARFRTNRQRVYGNLEARGIWKCRLGTRSHSGHSEVAEIDKKCVSTPVLSFTPAIGYDYTPSAHMMLSKLHLQHADLPSLTKLLRSPSLVLLSRLFPSVTLFLRMLLLLLLPPSFSHSLLTCSLSHHFHASQPSSPT